MNGRRITLRYAASISMIVAGGLLAGTIIGIDAWGKAATGLFVAFSVLAAAVLVRLARPSPFSNPDVFTDENVDRFFDALSQVAGRLSFILAAVVVGIVLLIVAQTLAGADLPAALKGWLPVVWSGMLGSVTTFLLLRLIALVRGDFGFILLQKEIVISSRRKKAAAAAGTIVSAQSTWKSPGGYGNLATGQ